MTQIVKVALPDRTWWEFAKAAEKRGLRTDELIEDLVANFLDPTTSVVEATHAESPRKHRMRAQAHVDTDDPAVAARVREMLEADETLGAIAAEFGVGYDAVRSALKRLGLQSSRQRPRVRVDLDRVGALHALNRSDKEIADELGIDYGAAYRARRFQLHLPPVGKPGRKSATSREETAA